MGLLGLGAAATPQFLTQNPNFKTLICQSPPGGLSDRICQIYKLAASRTREEVRVQGIPTSGGILAAKTLENAPADGRVIGMLGSVFCAQQYVEEISQFEQDDFTIIGGLAQTPMAMTVSDAFYRKVV